MSTWNTTLTCFIPLLRFSKFKMYGNRVVILKQLLQAFLSTGIGHDIYGCVKQDNCKQKIFQSTKILIFYLAYNFFLFFAKVFSRRDLVKRHLCAPVKLASQQLPVTFFLTTWHDTRKQYSLDDMRSAYNAVGSCLI